ncbi:MFS transporter [Nocardia testacea]|uniref:MFS transporter n=1 Tax=Nocardia testacea TaxID=248551 RepID=UPI0033DD94A9
MSTVLVATTLGGLLGPNLTAPTGHLAHELGIPYLAGPFVLAGAAYGLAALVLVGWLRPDPLLLARKLEDERIGTQSDYVGGLPHRAITGRGSGLRVGVLVMVLTQFVMVALMTMTPVHMRDHGYGTAAAGLVISVHVGAMYLPSPLTGRLVDRYGRFTIAAISGPTMLGAGILATTASGESVPLLTAALILLGLGWNFGLVAGTAIVTDAVPVAARATTQGMVDLAIAIAGAIGGMTSGLVVATAGYPLLAVGGGLLALAIVPAVAVAAATTCRQPPHERCSGQHESLTSEPAEVPPSSMVLGGWVFEGGIPEVAAECVTMLSKPDYRLDTTSAVTEQPLYLALLSWRGRPRWRGQTAPSWRASYVDSSL